MSSFDVRVFAIRRRPGPRVFEVRWRAAGGDKSWSFITRALADSYRAELIRAARRGLDFDPATGEPLAAPSRGKLATMPAIDRTADIKVTAAQGMVTAEIPLAGHASGHWLEFFRELAWQRWPAGLALTRRTRPRSSSSEEDGTPPRLMAR